MSALMKQLGVDRLSAEDQLTLAQDIWESLAAQGRSRLTEAQVRELERRLADDDQFPDDVIPWEKVKTDGRARIGQ
jgi:putative addiction module component (TIGR02574 family)